MPVTPAELAAVPLFASLSESELEELGRWFDTHSAGEGVKLAGEGAAGYSFFVLADGSAAVTAGGRQLASLGPGDFFGEMAILGDGRRSATVTTTSPTRLFVMFGTEFRQLQHAHPGIAAVLAAATEARRASD
jgi:voltage-gated potassium channel